MLQHDFFRVFALGTILVLRPELPARGEVEMTALFSCPEFDKVWVDQFPANLCRQFGFQIAGEIRYFQTPLPCDDGRVKGFYGVLFGERVRLSGGGRPTRLTRRNGETLAIEEVEDGSLCFDPEHWPSVSDNLKHKTNLNSDLIVAECRQLKVDVEHDYCLWFQAGFRRDPGICDELRSASRQAACRSWLSILAEGRVNGPLEQDSSYVDNDVQGTGAYVGGKRHGEWEGSYATGTRAFAGSYVDGRREGEWTEWYESGQQKSLGEYRDDERQGIWLEWHPSGAKKFETSFHGGRRDGPHKEWYVNGRLLEESDWRDGNRHGRYRRWTSDGIAEPERWFHGGSFVSKEWFFENVASPEERSRWGSEESDEFSELGLLCEQAKAATSTYLAIWEREFKRRNGISDEYFDAHVEVTQAFAHCWLSGATFTVRYAVTYGWARIEESDDLMILVYEHEGGWPGFRRNTLFSADEVSRSIDQGVYSTRMTPIEPQGGLRFASEAEALEALKSASNGEITSSGLRHWAGEPHFLASGVIDEEQNRCFRAGISLVTAATTFGETRCRVH